MGHRYRRDQELILAAALGAGVVYWLDPQSGRRRRHEFANRARYVGHQILRQSQTVARDVGHRVRGLMAEWRRHLAPTRTDDKILEARVRSQETVKYSV